MSTFVHYQVRGKSFLHCVFVVLNDCSYGTLVPGILLSSCVSQPPDI